MRRKDRTIEKHEIVENPFRAVETAKGIRVAEWLIEQGVQHAGMKEDVSRKGPGYVLSNGEAKLHLVSSGQMDEAVQEILAKE